MAIIATMDKAEAQQGSLFGASNRCRIESESGALAVYTPYLADFVADLKYLIAANMRSYDPPRRRWLINVLCGQTIVELIKQHFGEDVCLPKVETVIKDVVTGAFPVEYIGRCKPRGDESIAFGFSNNNWNFVFSEQVLRRWFERIDAPEEKEEEKQDRPKTFYQILRVKKDVSPADLKKGYYRMARQWHPDVCKESDARERFEQIKAAYDVLSHPQKRKRYDLGLKLQKQAVKAVKAPARRSAQAYDAFGYSPDLRCGVITLNGHRELGKIIVDEILGWEDIENANGDYLVTSWNISTNSVEKMWVNRNVIF